MIIMIIFSFSTDLNYQLNFFTRSIEKEKKKKKKEKSAALLLPFHCVRMGKGGARKGKNKTAAPAVVESQPRARGKPGYETWLAALLVLAVAIGAVWVVRDGENKEQSGAPSSQEGGGEPESSSILSQVQRLVDQDARVQNSIDKLLPIAVPPLDKNIIRIGTDNFNSVVNRSSTATTLVVFFEPRSESYKVTKSEFELTAKDLLRNPELSDVQVGMVNVAIDTYLQFRYSQEITSSWQENEKGADYSAGFLFGKQNFYPIVTKLFLDGGKRMYEYPGAVKSSEITEWIRIHRDRSVSVLTTLKKANSFLDTDLPVLLGCFEDWQEDVLDSTEAKGASAKKEEESPALEQSLNCAFERKALASLAKFRPGWFVYGTVTEPSACNSLFANFRPCTFVVKSRKGHPGNLFHFDRTMAEKTRLAESKYQKDLISFLIRFRDPFMVELTPDNSWSVIQVSHLIVIALLDVEDTTEKSRIEQIIQKAATKALEGLEMYDSGKFSVKFTYASGSSFAGQFDIKDDEQPNIVAYDTLEESFDTFSSGKGNRAMLLQGSDEDSARHVQDWLSSILVPYDTLLKEKQAEEDAKAENATKSKAHEDTESLPLSVDAASKPFVETDHPEDDDTNDDQGGDEDAKAKEEDKTDAQADKSDAQPEPKKATKWGEEKREKIKTAPRWESLYEFDASHLPNGGAKEGLDFFTTCYQQILEYQEMYEHLDAESRQRPENVLVKRMLDQFQDIINDMPYLNPIIGGLPKTPSELAQIESHPEKKKKFWAKIQQASAFKHHLEELLEKNSTTKEDREKVMRLFADAKIKVCNLLVRQIKQASKVLGEMSLEPQTPIDIDRRHVDDLTVTEFINEYAKKRKPVIIQGLDLFKRAWTREHISAKCGRKRPEYNEKDITAQTWGGLVTVPERVRLDKFLDSFATNKTRRRWYLHDWSLPRYCPEIIGEPPFDEFKYPRYFAGDYFQRIPFVGYQHTWPSLFVGANNTESRLHIDSGGTGFWMYLIEGKKEWRFYDRLEKHLLYANPFGPNFYFDPFELDYARHPLAKRTNMYRNFQHPGELVFIPAGCPHAVRNHDDIIGISMNFVDVSNEFLYKWEALFSDDLRDYELYASSDFPRGLRSDQSDLTLGEFKSQEWYSQNVRAKLDLF